MSFKIYSITIATILTLFCSCEKKDPEPEITNFPLSFVLVNKGNKDIDVNFTPTVYYPLGNFTRFAWKRVGIVRPNDTAKYFLGGDLAYKGCERVFNLDVWMLRPDIDAELHWEFSSGLDTVADYEDRHMVFEWPKDAFNYYLIEHDTIPLNKKSASFTYKPEEISKSGRHLK